jgi:hypothetical protein
LATITISGIVCRSRLSLLGKGRAGEPRGSPRSLGGRVVAISGPALDGRAGEGWNASFLRGRRSVFLEFVTRRTAMT